MKRIRAFNVLALLVLIASAFLATPRPVSASTTIIVNTTVDEFFTDPYTCSLREAIWAANNDYPINGCPAGSGTDTITLKRGVYILDRTNPVSGPDDQAITGDLDILQNLVINGAGMDEYTGSVVYANSSSFGDRIFHVKGSINVYMNNLRIQGGFINLPRGGAGILNEGANLTLYRAYLRGNIAAVEGGGITNYHASNLKITYSTFDNNTSGDGGGIYNVGSMILENSLLINNTGDSTGGGMDNGVGLVGTMSVAIIKNTTIAKNKISDSSVGGGGLSNSGSLTLINNTIAENGGTGLLVEINATTVVRNTIFSQGTYPNCALKAGAVPIVANGYNLVYGSATIPAGQLACSWGGTDLVGSDSTKNPLLKSLDYYDSVTKTYGFTSKTSPAVDAIPLGNTNCPSIDQRMHGRWADGNEDGTVGCDIGAYEEGGRMLRLYMPFTAR